MGKLTDLALYLTSETEELDGLLRALPARPELQAALTATDASALESAAEAMYNSARELYLGVLAIPAAAPRRPRKK